MGTWGTGVFDNDEAIDWSVRLYESPPRFVDATLARLNRAAAKGPVEPDDLIPGLTAAEVVAVAVGHPEKDLLDNVRSWVDLTGFRATSERVSAAQALVERAREQAALWEWEEAGDSAKWKRTLAGLANRLAKPVRKARAVPERPESKRRPGPGRARAGDVVCVEIGPRRHAVTKVLWVERVGIRCVLLGVYDLLLREPHMPLRLPRPFLASLYATSHPIRVGKWPVVGRERMEPEEQVASLRLVGTEVRLGDKKLRHASRQDMKNIPAMISHSDIAAVEVLQEALKGRRATSTPRDSA